MGGYENASRGPIWLEERVGTVGSIRRGQARERRARISCRSSKVSGSGLMMMKALLYSIPLYLHMLISGYLGHFCIAVKFIHCTTYMKRIARYFSWRSTGYEICNRSR